MKAAISLLVLLFSMCGIQTRSTQTEVKTESQSTGAAAATAEVSTQPDVSAELKELRDIVVELRTILRYTQDEVKVLEADNVAMKTRLTVAEAEVTHLKLANKVALGELVEHGQELAALKTRLAASETAVGNLGKENGELKTRLAASEAEMEDLMTDSEAHEQELAALKSRLAATQTEVENLEKYIKAAPKVAFSAGLSSGYIESGSNHLNLVFSRVITNVGEAYSSMTGFFTAPVRGVYYFRFTVRDDLDSRNMDIRMNKNGEQLIYMWEYETDGRPTYLSSGLTLQLEKGDVVNLMIPANKRLVDNTGNQCTFSGFLLFPL